MRPASVEKFSEYLYGAGGGTDPLGLAALIPDDPTTGTLGGMSRATETQWRTSAYQFSGTLDPTNIEEAFDDILMDLKMKGDKPDLILVGRNIYRMYRQAVRDKIVINLNATGNGKAMFDLGFEGVSHNGINMLYDEDCGVNRAYFINTSTCATHILKGVNMRPKNLTAPWTIDAIGKRVVWQGQFASWKQFRTHRCFVAHTGTSIALSKEDKHIARQTQLLMKQPRREARAAGSVAAVRAAPCATAVADERRGPCEATRRSCAEARGRGEEGTGGTGQAPRGSCEEGGW